MDRFARVILGYHGCEARFATRLLDGTMPIDSWNPSENKYDWLGRGIYFWEHSPLRALRWARERRRSKAARPAVVGAVVQLGRCFDLLNEEITSLLTDTYGSLEEGFRARGEQLPKNRGPEGKMRVLDCLVINDCLDRLGSQGIEYDTVRGAFREGPEVYPGAGFARETHIQVAVRNPACILGVFRPSLGL
jgi:hypothetical protein